MSGLRLTWYGDDFSGSTDVLEVLALAGVPARLFLTPPTPDQCAGLQAVGIAGISRSLPTAELDRELPPVFAALKRLGAPLCHYKVCSTFDSSPAVGSIGRAIEIGQAVFGTPRVPLVVGAPPLGRYCAFGNLFARSGQDSPVYRLDRHPTMSRHPVTPMAESDLRLVLAQQTTKRVDLIDVTQLAGPPPGDGDVVLYDVTDESHLPLIGRAVWEQAERRPPLFAVGSSGLEYAFVAHWRLTPPPPPTATTADRILVVSGSCSPVTARQIDHAVAAGFAAVPLEDGDAAVGHLAAGRSVVVHSARGPDDPRLTTGGERVGRALARVARLALERSGVRRVVVCGGDTSGHVARALGVEALAFVAPIAPGSPLCRVTGGTADGAEMLFKGGQVGKADLFERIRQGKRQT